MRDARPPDEPTHDAPSAFAHLADFMPVAVAVLDREAQILYVNHHAGELFGRAPADLVGTSAFALVDDRDRDFAAKMLAFAPEHHLAVLGPASIRFLDCDGTSQYAQLRSYDCPGELGIDGYILTLTTESTHDLLVSALASVGPDEDVENTLEAICRSTQGDPLSCHAAMLVPTGGAVEPRFSVVGEWLVPLRFVNAENMPWRAARADGRTHDVLSTEDPRLDPDLRGALADQGLAAAWVRPVFGPSREVSAVLVLWRALHGPASPNQERFIDDAVQFSRLAFDQVNHRRELEQAARRDGLTGVANRRAFKERLNGAERSHDVLFIDLDHFKEANDTFGHDVGDQILTQVADRISQVIRAEDVLYRTGGDEFVVICEGIGMALDEHGRLAARVIERLSTPFDCGPRSVRIGATVGIATGTARTLPDTVRAADAALYAAKDRGRGCWRFAEPLRSGLST